MKILYLNSNYQVDVGYIVATASNHILVSDLKGRLEMINKNQVCPCF